MAKTKAIDKHKGMIVSAIFLALLTPFLVKFITSNTTSTVNYAAAPKDSESSITLNPTENKPAIGDYVSFTATYPKNIKNPRIEVLCYQNNELTFGMAGGVDYEFLLGGAGSIWVYEYPTEGAECVANLYYFGWDGKNKQQTYNKLASTGFSALGRSQ